MAKHIPLMRGRLVCSLFRVARGFDLSKTTLPLCQQAIQHRHTNPALFHTCNKALSSRHINEAIVTEEQKNTQEDKPWMADLKKRGLYSKARYGQYEKYKVNDFTISEDKKSLAIDWDDGHTSNFDAIWLRHLCHCGACKHDTNGMMKINWNDLPLDISLLSAKMEDDKLMILKWGTPEGKELHQGCIPTSTLRCYCYSDKAIKDRRDKKAMKFSDEKIIPEIEYDEIKASEEGLYKCMTQVNETGICLVKNVPGDLETFLKTVKLFGPIQNTMYGEYFEVISTPRPVNAAYSNFMLPVHMDLPFYETAPGMQILHCVRFDENMIGGANTFLDIHEVAHKFRREYPEFFDRLARLPAVYNSIHYNRDLPVHMENQKTIFSLNHFGELVCVTWHPMVQGPVELPKKDVLPFYEAYSAFAKMVYSHDMYRMKFTEGDFIIVNNRRVLHGRDAFTGGRKLQGAYVEVSDFHSRVQALHNKLGDGRLAYRSGSHSWL